MSLFLIGMRGSGKSAAGALAAARLQVPFRDTDRVVEDRAGQSLARFFAERGEPAFRALEHDVLLELLPVPGQICAGGGGCVLDGEVRAALRRHGLVVWLTAPAPVLATRIRGSDRPSLTGAAPEEELAPLLFAREPLYRSCADQIISTEDRSLDEVARDIEQLWNTLPHHQLR